MGVGLGGSDTFRGCYAAVAVAGVAAFVVTTFVSTQGLSGREGLVADRALVRPTAAVGDCGCGGGGGGGGRGCGGGGVVVADADAAAGEFSVAGFVSTECLVGRERLVAN